VPDQAEIIPFEPDTGNAGVGNKTSSAYQVNLLELFLLSKINYGVPYK
jgi:hypothetical protein